MKKLLCFLWVISVSHAALACTQYAPTTVVSSSGVAVATPVMGSTSFSYGSNSYVTSSSGTTTAIGSGSSLTNTGQVIPQKQSLPAFSPTTFPAVGGADQSVSNSTLAAGSYGTVSVNNTGTFSGGNYNISSLTTGNGDTLNLAAGSYFVNSWVAGNNFTLNVSSGPVKIYINSTFQAGNSSSFNVSGSTANLQIYAYSTAQLQFGNDPNNNTNVNFNGLIYAPGSATQVQFGNGNVIQGSVLGGGAVQLGNNTGVIFDAATQAAIASIAVAPTGGLCHYQLAVPSSSINCLANTLTVTACGDTSSPCTLPYTTSISGTTAQLSASGGTLAATTVTFNSAGVASTTLSYPAAAEGAGVTVTLSGEQLAAADPRQCCPDGANCGVANSCNSTFHQAGFLFSSAAGGGGATIPAQVAGTSSATYYLRAVKAIDSTSQTCSAAFVGTQSINLGYECNNPTVCYAANLLSVNGGIATTIARNNSGAVSSFSAVNLTFDANGNAPFTFNYSNVGQLRLWANKTVANTAVLSGSSNAFVVKPAGFVLSGIQQTASPSLLNPAAATATGTKFVKAGEAFSATVTARTSTGATAYSYGQESIPETVKLTSALTTGLSLTDNPAIAGSFGAFVNGVATGTAFSWSEVGIITLTPSVGDATYLGAGDVTGTTTGNIGRFYPDHFDTVIAATASAPMACPTLLSCAASGFIYSAQPFSVTVNAKSLGGNTLLNYQGAFAKAVTLGAWDAPGSTTIQNPSGTLANGSLASTLFSSGSATTALPTYTLSTAATAPTNIYIRATDGEASSSSGEAGLTVGNGRIKASNSYGSEYSTMSMTFAAQYWNGSAWMSNDKDNSSSLSFSSSYPVVKTGVTGNTTTPSVVSGNLSGGIFNISLSIPSKGVGVATINPTTPGYLSLSGGSATFGVYGGKKAIIYMRENY